MDSSKRDKLLGGYLAGLIEGDGTIIVPNTTRNSKGKLLYPSIKIVFFKKKMDLPLALLILKIMGKGTIQFPMGTPPGGGVLNLLIMLF